MPEVPSHRPSTGLRSSPPRTAAPQSPCILVCQVDTSGTCLGCGRTLDEIGRWGRSSVEEQWKIVDAAEVRLAEIQRR